MRSRIAICKKGAMVNGESEYEQHSYPDTANLADRSLEENVVIQKMMEFERLQHIEEDQVWTMSDDQETRSKRP